MKCGDPAPLSPALGPSLNAIEVHHMDAIAAAYQKYCRTVFAPASEYSIRELEHRARLTFSPDYHRYLLDYNGGFFVRPQIEVDVSPRERLEYMCGIGALHSHAELATARSLAIFDENDPPEIVPIGGTERGSLILLVTHEEDFGTIALRTFTETYWLADDIEGFFQLLKDP